MLRRPQSNVCFSQLQGTFRCEPRVSAFLARSLQPYLAQSLSPKSAATRAVQKGATALAFVPALGMGATLAIPALAAGDPHTQCTHAYPPITNELKRGERSADAFLSVVVSLSSQVARTMP